MGNKSSFREDRWVHYDICLRRKCLRRSFIFLSLTLIDLGPASANWIDSFCVFSDRKREFFNTSNMGLLTGYCYPTINAEELLACTDWINLILVVDEYCDEQDGTRAREVADIFLDALSGKFRDDSAFSRIATE